VSHSDEKRRYAPPRLEVYGTVAELTAGGSGERTEFLACRRDRDTNIITQLYC